MNCVYPRRPALQCCMVPKETHFPKHKIPDGRRPLRQVVVLLDELLWDGESCAWNDAVLSDRLHACLEPFTGESEMCCRKRRTVILDGKFSHTFTMSLCCFGLLLLFLNAGFIIKPSFFDLGKETFLCQFLLKITYRSL